MLVKKWTPDLSKAGGAGGAEIEHGITVFKCLKAVLLEKVTGHPDSSPVRFLLA